jgi:hypothetical protein
LAHLSAPFPRELADVAAQLFGADPRLAACSRRVPSLVGDRFGATAGRLAHVLAEPRSIGVAPVSAVVVEAGEGGNRRPRTEKDEGAEHETAADLETRSR